MQEYHTTQQVEKQEVQVQKINHQIVQPPRPSPTVKFDPNLGQMLQKPILPNPNPIPAFQLARYDLFDQLQMKALHNHAKKEVQVFDTIQPLTEKDLKQEYFSTTVQVKVWENEPRGRELSLIPIEECKKDLTGTERAWNNWVIKSFEPTKAIVDMKVQEKKILLSNNEPRTTSGEDGQSRNKLFENYLQQCLARKMRFRDSQFEPTQDLSGNWNLNLMQWNGIPVMWSRPPDLFDGKSFKVFEDVMAIDTIRQGVFGNSYFFAAVFSLAAIPKRIQRLFRHRQVSEVGMYCVSFCLHGVWEDVIIDDRIPCHKDAKIPLFSSNRGNEIWVPLIEKAWAKVHGGFLNIAAGTVEEALHALTGAPTVSYSLKDGIADRECWEAMLEARRRGYVMACATNDFKDRKCNERGVDQATGLVGAHAYSILGVYEVTIEGGKPRRLQPNEKSDPKNLKLIKLRNPWGKTEWKRDWSDDSAKWTPELIQLLGRGKTENDGLFYMSYEDYVKHFANVVVSKYNDNYFYSGAKLKTSPIDPTALVFQIEKAGNYCFTLSQISKRFFPDSEEYVYSACSLFIATLDKEGKIREFGCGHEQHEHTDVEAELQPGIYIAYICTPWRRKVNEIGFSIYGPKRIESVVVLQEGALPKDFVTKFFYDKALRMPRSNLKTFAHLGLPEIGYMSDVSNSGLGFIMFENKSKDVQVTAALSFSDPQSTIFYPAIENDQCELVICPGKMKLIAFRMTNPQSGFTFKQSVSFESDFSRHMKHIKEEGQKQERVLDGKEVGIRLFVLKYRTGMGFLYENTSKNLILKERIKFDLQNCKLTGGRDTLFVELRPGKQRLVLIMKEDEHRPFQCKIASCDYEINQITSKDYITSRFI